MKFKTIPLMAALTLAFASNTFAILQWPMTVTNIAELQSLHIADVIGAESAYTTSTKPAVYVLGYYNEGDRGGGMFEWDPNSSGTPDGGFYFTTNGWTSGNGRWVRQLIGETPNVKMWGACGNILTVGGGTTPAQIANATNDTVAIQNALNAANNLSGEMLFPGGYYKITNTLVWTSIVKLRGEGARLTALVMPYGINKDILVSQNASNAIVANNGTYNLDDHTRIEDLTFYFATQNGAYAPETGHNMSNSAVTICFPDEGTCIKNIDTAGGAFGIRCFGGGGGAVAAFRDVVCSDAAVAGIEIEPVPGASHAGGQVSITGITGDHRWDESYATACLVRLYEFDGSALIQDINAEGSYGGGVIQVQTPNGSAEQYAMVTIRNGALNGGSSYDGFYSTHDFAVIKDGGSIHSASLILDNIGFFGGNTIRDELTGRNVMGPDAQGQGINQAAVRIPIEYESWNYHANRGDGTPMSWNRLIIGGQAVYSFNPPTNGWYRIMEPVASGVKVDGRVTVASLNDSSEFEVDLLTTGSSDASQINVTRANKNIPGFAPPCVPQVRSGVYQDTGYNLYGFVDLYVTNIIPAYDLTYPQITISTPVEDAGNKLLNGGISPLLYPTNPIPSIVPAGCTLLQSVTNSLIR